MLLRLLFLSLLPFSTLFAIELDIKLNGGLFYSGAQGIINYEQDEFQGSYSNIDLSSTQQLYLSCDIRSTYKYLPILRLQYLKIHNKGDSKLHLESNSQNINDIIDQIEAIVPLNNRTWHSELTQNVYDIYLYYEFYKEVSPLYFGVGGGLKSFDYAYNVELEFSLQIGDRGGKSVPMLFLMTRYDTDVQLGFEAQGEFYVFGDSQLYDVNVKMDLLFDVDATTKAGLEIGYKESYYNLRGDDVDIYKADMNYKGLFVGLVAYFH